MRQKEHAYIGEFGGQYVSELLVTALDELEQSFENFKKNASLQQEFQRLLKTFAGRPTPLYYAPNLSKKHQAKIYLKREDLLHTGAHKINNTLGQVLLAKSIGKKRIIAETGAGQHGVATACACALLQISCTIYMGSQDIERQEPNIHRIKLFGAKVISSGGLRGTLRHAINDALRDWSSSFETTHYLLGSVVGPYPFPQIVEYMHACIGKEAKQQILKEEKKLPHAMIACVGGGSNAVGLFSAFESEPKVKLFGAEAGGTSSRLGNHAATLSKGKPGILHGCHTYLLQTSEGQVADVHSISAGLDYPGVGPKHAYYKDSKRVTYFSVSDSLALSSFYSLAKLEGIIPALESSHALALIPKVRKLLKSKKPTLIVNISGRGDKDVNHVKSYLESHLL